MGVGGEGCRNVGAQMENGMEMEMRSEKEKIMDTETKVIYGDGE